MKSILLCLAIFIGMASSVSAQSDSYSEAVKKMINVSGGAETSKIVVPQMISMMKVQYPNVPESYWKELENEFNEKAFNDLVELLVPVYRKHFTETELREVIKFYDTPIGKKMAASAPQIGAESMQIGQQWGMELGKKLQARLTEKGY